MSNLTVFVITTGEESMDKCLDAIERQKTKNDINIDVQTIKDVYPMSEAFNEMHRRCRTPYFIQVDADVILKDNAVDKLYRKIKNSNFFAYAAYGQLYEEGFGPGGSVRCWKKNIFRIFKFKDVRTVDRDFFRRTRLLGFHRQDIKDVIGVHRPRHSDFSDYLKTKSDVEKWQFLKRPFKRYAEPLIQNLMKDQHKNRYRILGFSLGVLTSKDRIYRSKDISVEKERVESVSNLLNIDFGRFTLKEDIKISRFLNVLRKAYCNYSAVKKKAFTAEVFKELFDADLNTATLKELYKRVTI